MNYEPLNPQNSKAPLVTLDVNCLYPYPGPKHINIEEKMQHFKTLFDMKTELKALVATIRAEKEYPRANHTRAMHDFRHLHVARCLIKGRTLLEIEGPDNIHDKSGNRLNKTYLQRLLDKWQPLHDAEQVKWKEFCAQNARELVPVMT